MNILYISNHLNIGGVTSYLLTLARGLKDRGHNIYIASSGGELLQRFTDCGAVYINIPIKTKKELSPKILRSVSILKKAVREYNIDIIHTHSRTTQVLGALLSRKTKVLHVSTCHGFFKRRLLRRLFPCWGERVIAISEPVREHLVRDFKIKPESIKLIHSGIDANKFTRISDDERREARKEFNLGEGPAIGILGRLSDVKGHRYLFEAMPEVLKGFPSAKLFIIGEGKMKEELVSLAKKLGIEKSVIFIPSIEDTSRALSAMDVFAMPSLKEGLGLSLMEAMACSLAVVGSNIGGIKSLIRDNENGLLVEPKDSKGLAAAILRLLKDSAKRDSLGRNARKFIEEHFSENKMVEDTQEFYQECLRQRKQP